MNRYEQKLLKKINKIFKWDEVGESGKICFFATEKLSERKNELSDRTFQLQFGLERARFIP